ncbi:MAG: leucine-rich repeat domain-containing protein [Clostridiales bacterium]|nr:leucine-rich repeat domain-containing protein [Clostridiales bacterium]
MKKKFSLFINIATICLCVCAIAIGVWSAKRAELSVSGNIGFTANNCTANISVEVDGAATSKTAPTEDDWYIQNNGSGLAKTESTFAVNGDGIIDFKEMYFSDLPDKDDPDPIKMTFKIENTSNFPIVAYVLIGDDILGIDADIDTTWNDASTTLLEGESSIIRITLTCNSYDSFANDIAISGDDIKLVLEQASILDKVVHSESYTNTFTLSSVLTGNDLPQEESTTNWYNITGVTQTAKADAAATSQANVDEPLITDTKITFPAIIRDGATLYKINGVGNNGGSPVIPDSGQEAPTSIVFKSGIKKSLSSIMGYYENEYVVSFENGFTEILSDAFACSWLTDVDLPNTLITIGDYAFGDTMLSSVDLNNGLRTLDRACFAFVCLDVTIPKTVTSMEYNSFCYDYEEPAYVEVQSLEQYLMLGCYTPSAEDCCIYVSEEVDDDFNTWWPGWTEIPDRFMFEGVFGDLIIPDCVEVIGLCAFRWGSANSVTLPAGIKRIKDGAFESDGSKSNFENMTVYYKGTSEQWADVVVEEYAFPICQGEGNFPDAVSKVICADGVEVDIFQY